MKHFKKESPFAAYVLWGFLTLCVVVPGTLLFVEYYQMKKAAHRLLELKNDYRSYTMTLKRLLRERTQEATEEVKKNSNLVENEASGEPEAFFSLVNRDPDYLRSSALDFAKEHNLERAVAHLFATQSWDDLPSVKTFPGRVRKKKQTTVTGMPIRARFLSAADRKYKPDMDFSWPVEKSKFWFSSPFGPRKIGKNGWKFHYGVDLAALRGTPVRAAAAGVVIQSDWHKGYGNCITIVHNRKYKTRYAHLHTRKVQVGQKVKRGGVIGTVGDTGFVRKIGKDASHLHFEVYSFGRHINPVLVLA